VVFDRIQRCYPCSLLYIWDLHCCLETNSCGSWLKKGTDTIAISYLNFSKYISFFNVCLCMNGLFVIHNLCSTNILFNYRTNSKPPGNISDLDVSKSSQLSPILTVSSNFEVHSPTSIVCATPFSYNKFDCFHSKKWENDHLHSPS